MPEFTKGMTTYAKVEACLHLLERRRDALHQFPALASPQPAAQELGVEQIMRQVFGSYDAERNNTCFGPWMEVKAKLEGAIAATQEAVAVKPLEWKKTVDYYRGSERREQWMAETPWGNITIWNYRLPDDELRDGPKFHVGAHMTPYRPHEIDYPTFEEAKAAARADYESRIRLALASPQASEPAPQVVGDLKDETAALREELGRLRNKVSARALTDRQLYEEAAAIDATISGGFGEGGGSPGEWFYERADEIDHEQKRRALERQLSEHNQSHRRDA